MRTIGVVEAAAVGPQLLDDLLARHRPARNVLTVARQRRDVGAGREILHHARCDKQDCANHRNRQQQPEANAGEVNPEVAQAAVARAGEAADEGESDCDTDRCGGEVLNREPGHLGQIAHRGLTRVRLPVRVRHKTHRGIPRLIRCHAGKT